MQTVSISRVPAPRPRPSSAQSFASPPARSEAYPYAVSRQHLKNKSRVVPTPETKASHNGQLLKPTKSKPTGSRGISTISECSNIQIPSLPPSSRSKHGTISPGPISQASRRQTLAAETLENVVPITTPIPRSQKQVSQRRELGPENWTPITLKAIESTPPPRMKIHRHRRAAILSEDGTSSLFGPVQSLPNQKHKDVSYDKRCESPSSLSRTDSESILPHTPPFKKLSTDVYPEPAPKPLRTRSALSLPIRHHGKHTKAVNKTVTWDPSIMSIGPEVGCTSKSVTEENQNEMQNDVPLTQILSRKLDVEDCVETIKEWGKTDSSKLVSLIKALKQLELVSQDRAEKVGNKMPSNDHHGEVLITTVKSADRKVPDFDTSNNALEKNKANWEENSERYQLVEINLDAFSEPGCNKENIPEVPLQRPATLQDSAVPRIKKRITILDDYKSSGREVDSFADWYAEMQLREFAKRYPLTGRRSSAVELAANTSVKVANTSEGVRSISGGFDVATKEIGTGIKRGRNVSGGRDIERIGSRGIQDMVATKCRGDDISGEQYIRPRRPNMPPVNDSFARKNAAVIQEQLEVLLLKEKERKALDGMSEIAKISMRYVDGGVTVGSVNPYQECLNYDGSSPLGGSSWIPSERLRLQKAWQ